MIPRCCDFHTIKAQKFKMCHNCYIKLVCHGCDEILQTIEQFTHLCQNCMINVAILEME